MHLREVILILIARVTHDIDVVLGGEVADLRLLLNLSRLLPNSAHRLTWTLLPTWKPWTTPSRLYRSHSSSPSLPEDYE